MSIAQIMKSAINLSVSTSHVDWRISTAATSANSSLKAAKIKRENYPSLQFQWVKEALT
jgi:hypothetical protein